jgi:hypothetical protein
MTGHADNDDLPTVRPEAVQLDDGADQAVAEAETEPGITAALIGATEASRDEIPL